METTRPLSEMTPEEIKAAVREKYSQVATTPEGDFNLKSALPEEVRKNVEDWFRCIGGALPESDFIALMQTVGFERVEVLSKGRNARTGHELALCATIRAFKPLAARKGL